jgi:hypothetical protein
MRRVGLEQIPAQATELVAEMRPLVVDKVELLLAQERATVDN